MADEIEELPDIVVSMCNARAVERYDAAVRGQGVGFTELRTPGYDLPRDGRGLIVLPPVELFGYRARPRTADVLSGAATTLWGWPS